MVPSIDRRHRNLRVRSEGRGKGQDDGGEGGGGRQGRGRGEGRVGGEGCGFSSWFNLKVPSPCTALPEL